jgi:hypothetical protein
MPGPAPKRTRARRNDPKSGFVTLPSAGRPGEAPEWPLSADVSALAEKRVADVMVCGLEEKLAEEEDGRKRRTILSQLQKAMVTAETLGIRLEAQSEAELTLWRELWATPQAVEWERAHAFRAVATFVRWQIKAENGNIEATKEARMWSDRLGMNPLALQKLRQEVEAAGAAEERGQERRSSRKPPADAGKPGDRPDPRERLRSVG